MNSRILYLDIIRILACVMIVAMHAPIPNTGLNSYILSTNSLLTAPGIGMFIMISGGLLLPVNMTTKSFLKKRLIKIAGPTLFWTFFYMMVELAQNGFSEAFNVRSILSVPFAPQYNGTLWFVYMLAGLYLLAPILSAWLKQTTLWEIRMYLCLWGITLCYPIIRNFVGVNEGHTGLFYYFGGYAGYFLLGYYLRYYVDRISAWKCLLLILFPFCIATAIKLAHVAIDFYDLFWYLSVFIVSMAVGWFMLVKKLNKSYNDESNLHRGVVVVSNCCFGIYLIHILVMRSILWNWSLLQNMGGAIQLLVVTMLTFMGSFLITWLISHMPGAEYIIGFRQKK